MSQRGLYIYSGAGTNVENRLCFVCVCVETGGNEDKLAGRGERERDTEREKRERGRARARKMINHLGGGWRAFGNIILVY